MKRTGFSSQRKPMAQKSRKVAKQHASSEGKADLAYMGKVKQLPCCVCGKAGPSDAHHVFHDRFGSLKSRPRDVIPLCKAHHQDGPGAIHNGKETWRQIHGPDWSYIDGTRMLVGEMT